MATTPHTYDHTKLKINLNGMAITDLAGAVTVEESGDVWEETEGLNGTVTRSRHVRNLVKITIPFNAMSSQLALIEAFQIADEQTGAGPFPFAMAHLGGSFAIAGQAWIKSNRNSGYDKVAGSRTVVLSVFKNASFAGA
jgi:hypothetical protein